MARILFFKKARLESKEDDFFKSLPRDLIKIVIEYLNKKDLFNLHLANQFLYYFIQSTDILSSESS